MDRADLFVVPSRLEPLGIVPPERGPPYCRWWHLLPEGVPELIEDGVTGVRRRAEAAMRNLLLNAGRADGLAQAWHEQVLKRWSWERTAMEYLHGLRVPGETQPRKRD